MLENINFVLCGAILPFLIGAFGIYFLFKLKFFFILHPIKTIKQVFSGKGGASSLFVALSGTLGVGNIVGVASAIMAGGAGSVFWMMISALIAMSLKYAEVYLSIKYRQQENGKYHGGSFYYIRDGIFEKFKINAMPLGIIFAILCILNSLSTGNLVQVNTVFSSFNFGKVLISAVFSLLVLFVIIGGGVRIKKICSIIIPVLTFSFIIISVYIIASNISRIPGILCDIVNEAFSFRSAISGFLGYGIMSAMRYGISRGLLSNEAGCGTSPCAHAESPNDAHTQGCFGILEVFIDTCLLCSLTAIVILLYESNAKNAMELVISAFGAFLGNFGKGFILASCILFAYATVICQYFYGKSALTFITKKRNAAFIYSVAFISVCFLAPFIPMGIMWQISDLVIALMAIFNLTFIALIWS
jgi:AGCS family alanine or glycine:cation symporter